MTEFYKIVENPTTTHLITNSKSSETYNSEVYLPVAVKRSNAEDKTELEKASLDITLPLNHALSLSALSGNFEYVVTVTIFKVDTFYNGAFWKGDLTGFKVNLAGITFTFESIRTSAKRNGLSKIYQRGCPHMLYSSTGCKVTSASFAVAGTVSAIDGYEITIGAASSYTDGYFKGGFLESSDNVKRFIVNHVGNVITLMDYLDVPLSSSVTIYAGCDRTIEICDSRFSNSANYGGFPYIPSKNPFSFTSIV